MAQLQHAIILVVRRLPACSMLYVKRVSGWRSAHRAPADPGGRMMTRLHQIATSLEALALCAALGGMLFLSACGQKGPLYVPVEQTDQEQEKSSDQS